MKKLRLKNKDWFTAVGEGFDHPSVVLWRSIELNNIFESLKNEWIFAPVLDLGCGEGEIAKILFGKGVVDVGLDNDPVLLKEAEEAKIYQKVVIGDARNLPFQNGSFSTVFSNCVIEHIPEREKVVKEVQRVLKKNGVFIFTVPSETFSEYLFFYRLFSALGLKRIARKYSQKKNKILNHYHCYSHGRWGEILDDAGLKLVYYKYYISKETMAIWDLTATFVFVLNKLLVGRLVNMVCKRSTMLNKVKNQIFNNIFRRYYNYNGECHSGGALLLIAKNI